jgi:hypothetical protein
MADTGNLGFSHQFGNRSVCLTYVQIVAVVLPQRLKVFRKRSVGKEKAGFRPLPLRCRDYLQGARHTENSVDIEVDQLLDEDVSRGCGHFALTDFPATRTNIAVPEWFRALGARLCSSGNRSAREGSPFAIAEVNAGGPSRPAAFFGARTARWRPPQHRPQLPPFSCGPRIPPKHARGFHCQTIHQFDAGPRHCRKDCRAVRMLCHSFAAVPPRPSAREAGQKERGQSCYQG